jgi:predicted metalloendopeptidase
MNTYKKLFREAEKLVRKLQNDITTGKREMCEDYGQKEIQKFIEQKVENESLTYQEVCSIKDILNKVSSIC